MTTERALIAMCCLLAAVVTWTEGAEVTFREGGGSGYIDLTWDVASIITTSDYAYPPDNDSDWFSEAIRVSGDPCPPTEDAEQYYVLLAIKDLLTVLPLESEDITSATLTVTGCYGDGDTAVVYRVTTEWLTKEAGANEARVSGLYIDDELLRALVLARRQPQGQLVGQAAKLGANRLLEARKLRVEAVKHVAGDGAL